jgi:general secretion pathway protein G
MGGSSVTLDGARAQRIDPRAGGLGRDGFTLVEIAIVVLVLGILAAIVVPQYTRATDDARESVMQANRQILQRQINRYIVDHNGRGPAYNEFGALDAKNFIARMTGRTDRNGKLNDAGRFGPYLIEWLGNPYIKDIEKAEELIVGTEEIGARDDESGWYFDLTNLRILPNSSKGSLDFPLLSNDGAEEPTVPAGP